MRSNTKQRRPIILPVRLSRDEYKALAELARINDRSRCSMLRRLVAEERQRRDNPRMECSNAGS